MAADNGDYRDGCPTLPGNRSHFPFTKSARLLFTKTQRRKSSRRVRLENPSIDPTNPYL